MTAPIGLSQEEAFARIHLLRCPNIGPVTYHQLLKRFGDAQAALDAVPDIAARNGRKYALPPRDMVEREIAATRAAKAKFLFHDSPAYPALLREIPSAPPILTYRGNLALAAQPCLAIVGARNASAGAVKLARDFATAVAGAGITVVSGLARGIDGAAHEGALPSTIGVIASGIDIAYPPQHIALQERIANEGLLIAEQAVGAEPKGGNFPSRNRIIAGLSSGTLVVEAAPKSGSLITARLAGEAGREVMAIPGSPLDARSLGCNDLIRDGAILVQRPEDAIELLTSFDGVARSHFREVEAPSYDATVHEGEDLCAEPADIFTLLSTSPISIDELVRQSGEGHAAVQLAVLEMEISGVVMRHAGGRVSLSA